MLRRLRSPKNCVLPLFIGFPIIFCLTRSLVFSPSKPRSSSPRFHSSLLSIPSAPFPGSFSIVCVRDATFEPILRTWAPRRLCLLTPSGWIPPLLPCAVGSGYHIGWPSLIPIGTFMADHRLHLWETPSPTQDQLSSL